MDVGAGYAGRQRHLLFVFLQCKAFFRDVKPGLKGSLRVWHFFLPHFPSRDTSSFCRDIERLEVSSCYAIHINLGLCFSQEALLRSKQVCWLHQFEKISRDFVQPSTKFQPVNDWSPGGIYQFEPLHLWWYLEGQQLQWCGAFECRVPQNGGFGKDDERFMSQAWLLYQGCVCSCHFNVSILFLLMVLMLCLFCLNRWLSVETVSLRTKKLHSPVHSENSCCDLGHQGAISMCFFFSKCQTHLKR